MLRQPGTGEFQTSLLTDQTNEEIRLIRTNIQQMSSGKASTILVTSPEKNDHQALISCSLGASFAEAGKKVLLVDANFFRPSLHDFLPASEEAGFAEALHGSVPHIQPTHLPGVHVLAAGALHRKSKTEWTEENIRRVTQQLQQTFDVILFHASSFCRSADAQILSLVCDEAILVVTENKTKMSDLSKVKAALSRTGKKLSGFIYQVKWPALPAPKQNSIGQNVFHLFYSTAFASGLNALTLIFMANYLDAVSYGMFSVALAYAMVMGYFTDAGISVAVLREGSKKTADPSAVLVSYVKIRIALFALTMLGGFGLVYLLHGGQADLSRMMYFLIFPMVLGLALQSISVTYFQLIEKMQYLGRIRMLSAVLLISLTAIGILLDWSAYTISLLYGCSYLAAGVYGLFLVSRFVDLSFRKAFHRGLFDQMWLFVASGLLIVLLPQLGPITLQHTLTFQQIGFYAVAYRIPSALYQIPGILAGAVYPALFKHFNSGRLKEHFELNMIQFKVMSLAGMAMTIPLFYAPEWIIGLLFGSDWLFAADALRILSFLLVLQSMNIALADGLTTKGLQPRRTAVQGLAVLAGIWFYLSLSGGNGVAGAALAAILIEIVALEGYWMANPARKKIAVSVLGPYIAVFALSTGLIFLFFGSAPLLAITCHIAFLLIMAAADPSLRQFVFREKSAILTKEEMEGDAS